MAKPLTQEERDAMPSSDFAVPEKRALPIHDERHVRMANSQLNHTKGLTPEEKKSAKAHILRRAHELGIDTKDWEINASAPLVFTIEAMSLDMPDDPDHPNRMPFKGILTRVDEPSDKPPGGASGKRVFIPAEVAEEALSTLMGMGVDCTPDFSGHDTRFKIGVITAATISGNALNIAGHLYRDDFPSECSDIKSKRKLLGFSYECKVAISDKDADPWIVDRIVFTGAAILLKKKAAYETTSIAAQAQADTALTTAQADKDTDMTPEELKAMQDGIKAANDGIAKMTAVVTTVSTAVTAQAEDIRKLKAGVGVSLGGPIVDQVRPHVEACHACADSMEAAGIGSHKTMGHAAKIRQIGDHMMMAAVSGRIPHIYNDHSYFGRDGLEAEAAAAAQKKIDEATAKVKADAEAAIKAEADKNVALAAQLKTVTDQLAGLGTKMADLEAAAKRTGAGGGEGTGEPQRRTMGTEFVAKHKLTAGEDGKVSVADVDRVLEAQGASPRKSIETKLRLSAAGVL